MRAMPGSHSRDAPRFEGRKVRRFLEEFEAIASACGLDDKVKCRYVIKYCRGEAEAFVETSPEYKSGDWPGLKLLFEQNYPSEQEERFYTKQHLISFYKKDRHISDIASFDKYLCRFRIISNSLDEKGALVEKDRNKFFYMGVKPIVLCKELKTLMKEDKSWPNWRAPPKMDAVIEAAHDYLQGDCFCSDESGREDLDLDIDDSDGNGFGDFSSDEEDKRAASRATSRNDLRKKKSSSSKWKMDSKDNSDSSTKELMEKFDCLATQVEKQNKQLDLYRRTGYSP